MKTTKEQDDIARRNQLVHDLDLRDTINRLESRLAWAELMLSNAESHIREYGQIGCDSSFDLWLAAYACGPSDGMKGDVPFNQPESIISKLAAIFEEDRSTEGSE